MTEFLIAALMAAAPLRMQTPAATPEAHAVPAVSALPGTAVKPSVSLEEDHWFGSDKFRHLLLSYAATSFTFTGLQALGAERDSALAGGVVVGGALGIGKEIYDRRRGRAFSVRDLVADAVGIAAACLLLREVR